MHGMRGYRYFGAAHCSHRSHAEDEMQEHTLHFQPPALLLVA
jgi:hypothetical protein